MVSGNPSSPAVANQALGKMWWSSTALPSMTCFVRGVPSWKSRGPLLMSRAMVDWYRARCRGVTSRHRVASNEKFDTTDGASPPSSQDLTDNTSASAVEFDELSYVPLKAAHQNHLRSFARSWPTLGPFV